MGRRILSLALAAVIALGLSAAASAADGQRAGETALTGTQTGPRQDPAGEDSRESGEGEAVLTETSGDYTYSVSGGKAVVKGYSGEGGNVVIPGILDGYEVGEIGSGAFKAAASLASVTVPEGVVKIGNGAFQNCTSLERVSLPSSLASIDTNAFSGCTALKGARLPDALTSMGKGAFQNCASLTEITFPASLGSVGSGCFSNSGLKKAVFTQGCAAVPDYALSGANKLEEAVIPETVRTIGKYSFQGCSALKGTRLPDALSSMGDYAFSGCSSMESIDLPAELIQLGDCVFMNCASLKEITIPASLTKAGSSALKDSSLVKVTFAFGMKAIPDYICSRAKYLEEAVIPVTVKTVGKHAFSYCAALKKIVFPQGLREIGLSAFYDCGALEEAEIPDSVMTVGSQAFYGCTSLTYSLPDTVEDVGDMAFYGTIHEHVYGVSMYPSGNGVWSARFSCSVCGDSHSELLSSAQASRVLCSSEPTVTATDSGKLTVDVYGDDYDGRIFAAVNADYGEDAGRGAGYRAEASAFTAEEGGLQSAPAVESEAWVCARLPEPPLDELMEYLDHAELQTQEYTLSSTKTIVYEDESCDVRCLYIGSHCTVWGETGCDKKIRIDSSIAKKIGEKFDGLYDDVRSYFGTAAVDIDGDGKIAIFCHDINRDYGSYESGKAFLSGYFWGEDFRNENKADCIHIDTYPAMGYTKELSEVEDIYSILFHEYQHYISLSTKLDRGYDFDDPFLEGGRFMSEAFAMAAEHLVCGYSSVKERVTQFNSSVAKYPGRALFYWDEGDDSYFTNYGYAYVWGQYLRTRYAALTGDLSGEDAGAGIYKAILDRLTTDGKSQIEIAADILYSDRDDLTTSRQRAQELVRDFWIACCAKNPTGIYGFNNEEIARDLDVTPAIGGGVPGVDSGLMPGGAKYYYSNGGDTGTVTVTSQESPMVFAGIDGALRSRDIVLLLDYSSSISKSQTAQLKAAAKQFCRQVCDGTYTRVSVVTYNKSQTVRNALTASKSAVLRTVSRLDDSSSGTTYMAEALDTAAFVLEGSRADKQIIVLMSDGYPSGRSDNTSGKYASDQMSAVYDTAAGLINSFFDDGKDLDIYTLGFGTAADSVGERLLKDIADISGNDGTYKRVTSAADLQFAFAEAGSGMGSGGDKIMITINCPVTARLLANPEFIVQTGSGGISRTDVSTLLDSSDGSGSCDLGSVTVTSEADGKHITFFVDKYVRYFLTVEGTGEGTMDIEITDSGRTMRWSNVPVCEGSVAAADINFVSNDYDADDPLLIVLDEDGDGTAEEEIYPDVYTAKRIMVKLDPNGGTVDTPSVLAEAGRVYPLPAASRDGMVFAGWYTDAENGSRVTSDTVFGRSATVYAHWGQAVFETNGSGGIPPVSDGTVTYRVGVPEGLEAYVVIAWYSGGRMLGSRIAEAKDGTFRAEPSVSYSLFLVDGEFKPISPAVIPVME